MDTEDKRNTLSSATHRRLHSTPMLKDQSFLPIERVEKYLHLLSLFNCDATLLTLKIPSAVCQLNLVPVEVELFLCQLRIRPLRLDFLLSVLSRKLRSLLLNLDALRLNVVA